MKRIITFLLSLIGIAAIGFLAIIGAQTLIKDMLAPEPVGTTITGATVIEHVKQVNKHIFVEQYLSVPITRHEAPPSWGNLLERFGVRQTFVVLVRGTVPAGVDLSQLSENDVWVSPDGRRVQLTLPAPQIFTDNVALDPANSIVLSQSDFCPDLLCTTDVEVMRRDILPAGREALLEAAYQTGILHQAAEEAATYYEQLLRALGVDEVRVVVPGYAVSED